MPPTEPFPFDALEASFRMLTTGPAPLALDGRRVGRGLPARPVPLGELRSRLLHPATGFETRDAALAELARLAQARGGAWTVGLAGVLLPGLRRAVARLAARCPGHQAADLQAAALAGLLEAVRAFPAGGAERVAERLLAAAVREAERLRKAAQRGRRREVPAGLLVGSAARPACHPELALARAVAEGVISAGDAELVAQTRLGGLGLAAAAARAGLGYEAAKKRRQRAEAALAGWLGARRVSRNGR